MRAIGRSLIGICSHIINMFLLVFHATNIVLEGNILNRAIVVRRSKTQQLGDAFAVSSVLAGTLFEDLPTLGPDVRVFFFIFVSSSSQRGQYTTSTPLADRTYVAAFLQDLARNV